MRKINDNKTPHKSSEYDCNVRKTIPFYRYFHQQTVDLVKTIKPGAGRWLDTGCGTGYLAEKAIPSFKNCNFVLADSSREMLMMAKKRLKSFKNIKYLPPAETGDIDPAGENEFDVITAIMVHHYLNIKDRIKATANCWRLLKSSGVYVTFENIRPESDKMIDYQLDRWMNFQLLEGRSKKEVSEHKKRFQTKYFPIKVCEHFKLLKFTGFKIVEIFWLSYMQAGFFCIK